MEQALEVSGWLGWAPWPPLATQCRTVQLSKPLLPRLLQKTFQTLPFGCLRLRQQGSTGSARDNWVPPSMGAPIHGRPSSMGSPRPWEAPSMGTPSMGTPSMGVPVHGCPPSMGAPVHGCPPSMSAPIHGCPHPWVPRPWVPPSMGAPCPWVPLSMGTPTHQVAFSEHICAESEDCRLGSWAVTAPEGRPGTCRPGFKHPHCSSDS